MKIKENGPVKEICGFNEYSKTRQSITELESELDQLGYAFTTNELFMNRPENLSHQNVIMFDVLKHNIEIARDAIACASILSHTILEDDSI